MQIDRRAVYRAQTDFVPETRQEEIWTVKRGQTDAAQRQGHPNAAAGKSKEEQAETYQASEEGLMKLYLEQLEQAKNKAKSERDARNEEIKALKIAHNIMRGYRVPPQDESFLLTKNFKMYMAAKNVSMMRECQGEAGSELTGGEGSSGSSGASQAGSSEMTSIAAGEFLAGAGESAVGNANVTSGAKGEKDDCKSSVAVKNNSFADYYKYLEEKNRQYGAGQVSGLSKLKTKKKTKTRRRFFYNFKDVSNRIVRAKTSGNARQVYTSAKLKCAQLRRKMRTGEYDDEALRIALIHAEAMERVAKKKMRHLQEEEIAKRGGPCAGDTEREDIEEQMRQDEQAQMEQETQGAPANGSGMPNEGSYPSDGMSDMSIEEIMADSMQSDVQMLDLASSMDLFIEEFAALMKDATEEMTGLGELAEELMGVSAAPDMDPEDLKALKLKHRTEEQRKIAEADSKYLKALFQKLQREQQAVAQGAAKIAEAIVGNNSSPMLSLTGSQSSGSAASATPKSSAGGGQTAGSAASSAPEAPVELVGLSAAKASLSADVPVVSSGEAVSAVVGMSFDVSV